MENKLICQCCGMPLDESTFSRKLMERLIINIVSGVIKMVNTLIQIWKI